jgi:hypothetical protein
VGRKGRIVEFAIEQNVKAFIRAIRAKREALLDKWQRDHYNFGVFESVTQAVVIQFHEPDFLCGIFTCDPNQPDLSVQIIADLKTSEIPNKLPDLLQPLEQQTFESAWGNDRRESLKTVIEFAIKGFLDVFLWNAMLQHSGFIISPAKNVCVYRKTGLWQSLDVNATINRELALAELFRNQPFQARVFSAARFPKIQPGPERPPTFSEEIKALFSRTQENPWDLREPFWKTKYGQVELTVFSSGVVVADTPHVTAALESLNSLLAMASFLHLFCVPANRWDLGSITISEHGAVHGWGGPPSVARVPHWPKKTATESELQNCIGVFEAIQGDTELMAQLRLRHASATHLLSSEYLQAFLLAWAVVEREIERRWLAFLEAKSIDIRRIQKLLKGDDFTVNQLVEILELVGGLDTTIYPIVQRLRKVRNDVVHRGSVPTDEQSRECVRLANTFITIRVEAARILSDKRISV